METSLPKELDEAGLQQFLAQCGLLTGVQRTNKVLGGSRFENSAEHSWHAALTAYLLRDWADEPLNIDKVTHMLLFHDLIEVVCGDTSPFELLKLSDKKTMEAQAAITLFSSTGNPRVEEIHTIWKEFESGTSPEARYARAIDMFVPLFLHVANNGTTWGDFQITRSKYVEKKREIEAESKKLWTYFLKMVDYSVKKGWIQEG